MSEVDKTKSQLIEEIYSLRRQVDESKKMDEAYRHEVARINQSEERFRSMVEHAYDAIYIISPQGFEYVNKAFEGVTGYISEEVCRKTFNFWNIILPEDRVMIQNRVEARKRGENVQVRYVFRLIAKDGMIRHVEATTVEIGKAGESRVLGILREVTDQQKMQEALACSEKNYRDLVDHALLGVYKTKLDGTILFANDALANMFGYEDSADFRAEKITNRYKNPEYRDILINQVKQDGKVTDFEIEVSTKEGKTKYVSISAKIEGDVFSGMVIDVTRRKLAEDRLKESEARYRSIVELAPDGIVTCDIQGLIMNCNTSFLNMMGYAKEKIVGRHFSKIPVLRPEDIPLHLEAFGKLAKGDIPKPYEFVWTGKEGTPHVGEIRVSFLRAEGRRVGIQAIIRDITERKQAEDRIKASLLEKELLLQEVHHRVKNNLQVISSLLSLQGRTLNDKLAKEIFRETKDRIRSLALVHEQLYRSEDLARIDFTDYVRDLTTHLFHSHSINSSAIEMQLNIDDVYLDINTAIPCGLIINELVTNALKHAFPMREKGRIWINLESKNNGNYLLSVRDDGVGFPSELDFQNTESLGLQLVNMLVHQLNGTISINGSGGTEFQITFQEVSLGH